MLGSQLCSAFTPSCLNKDQRVKFSAIDPGKTHQRCKEEEQEAENRGCQPVVFPLVFASAFRFGCRSCPLRQPSLRRRTLNSIRFSRRMFVCETCLILSLYQRSSSLYLLNAIVINDRSVLCISWGFTRKNH